MNLLTAGVMDGMVGASSCMKIADVSMSVYRQAQNGGDASTMKRALGYAADSMNSAKDDTQKAQESLEEAQKEAKEQAKAEQQAALNENAQEPTQAKQQALDNSASADTVEISNEGRSATQVSGQITVVQDATAQTQTGIPVQSGNTPITEAKIYTQKGNIRSTNIEGKLSVSA